MDRMGRLTYATWTTQCNLWDRVFKSVSKADRMEMLERERYSIKTRYRIGV